MIALEQVSKRYGEQVALHRITVAFQRGSTSVLIGPSGCGKSTLLRMIVGLTMPDTGRVMIDGEELNRENAARLRHSMGYVIQEGGLFPHLTAERNVALLAKHLRRPSTWISGRTAQLADLFRIPKALLERYPHELSGGQRQRISLMRALMLDPPILLLDEPLGALDPVTRLSLQNELKPLFRSLGKTVVMVTHDMNEAVHFGDTIIMLVAGRVAQCGTPADLLERPAEQFIRDFMRAQRVTLSREQE